MKDTQNALMIESVKRLCEIERSYRSILETHDRLISKDDFNKLIHLAFEAFELKNKIDLEQAQRDYSHIQIDNKEIAKAFTKIREGEEFQSIRGYKILYKTLYKKDSENENALSTDELSFAALNDDELFQHFHSWFDIGDYYFSKLQVGQIVTTESIPVRVKNYFDEIRETYAFGQTKSCISLCRVLLELCLIDRLSEVQEYKGALEKLRKKGRRKEFTLHDNINFSREHNLLNFA